MATSSASVAVVGSLSREAKVQPGAPFDGVILLKNTAKQPGEARVFQTDYSFQADGSNEFGEPGTHPRSNANWLTVTPARVKLAAGETVSIRYKGKVPADAKLRGSYWSMIMIEPLESDAETPAADAGKVAVGVKTKIRVGVQIVTEIGRNGKGELQILQKALKKSSEGQQLELDFSNVGERMLTPNVSLELFDTKGASVGKFEGGRSRIFPTCSLRSKINLTNVPAGKYSALVLLDAGGDQVMGAQYDLEIDP